MRLNFYILLMISCSVFQSCEKKTSTPEFKNLEWKIDTIKINNQSLIRAKSKFETKGLMHLNRTKIFEGEHFVYCEYLDFNDDGYEDIRAYSVKDSIGRVESFMYDDKTYNFKKVTNVNSKFEHIKENFYYTYSVLGCENWKWESTLIIINDFKAKRLMRIVVDDCNDEKEGVFVYNFVNDKEKLKSILPFTNELIQEANTRFEFLEIYWSENYNAEKTAYNNI